MLDITLRPLKDQVFDRLCRYIPLHITPTQITALAFVSGIISCICSWNSENKSALFWWLLNRTLDCLDGALARSRNQASDMGGFLDLLGDFIIYSLIPMSCVAGQDQTTPWIAVAALEATFHVNNFVLFYVAAVLEKRKNTTDNEKHVKELTSVAMKPALIEGFESGVLFTIMLAFPQWIEFLSWLMAALVVVGIFQRVWWLVPVLD
jgi:phosphatidylglycerophosphate synthase